MNKKDFDKVIKERYKKNGIQYEDMLLILNDAIYNKQFHQQHEKIMRIHVKICALQEVLNRIDNDNKDHHGGILGMEFSSGVGRAKQSIYDYIEFLRRRLIQ